MAEEEIKTFSLALSEEVNGIAVSIPWAQRQANGAVIVRLHATSPKHTAGELLLNESDVIALDTDERPLRTQVRRFWGYTALAEVTPAHMQTARFDVGFRLDLNTTGGQCGIAISIMRSFRPGEGPKAVGGPWVFKFRVTDDQEAATLARAEAARQETARLESARQEAARQEAMRLDAERREAARLERARADAARAERLAAQREPTAFPDPDAPGEAQPRPVRPETDQREPGRGRRPPRFLRPDEAGRGDDEALPAADLLGDSEEPSVTPPTPPGEAGRDGPPSEPMSTPAPSAPRRATRPAARPRATALPVEAAEAAAQPGDEAAPAPRSRPSRRGPARLPAEPDTDTQP